MRHALTLEPTTPRATSHAHAGSRFRHANTGLAAVHLVQAVLVVVIAGDVDLPITHQAGGDASAPLTEVSVGVAMSAYFLAAAVSHALCATALRRTYEEDLRSGRNRIRWVAFAFSAPILMTLIALYAGVTDLGALVVVGAATLVMIACGWMQEAVNRSGRSASTIGPFGVGVVAAVIPWAIVAGQMIGAAGTREFSLSIFLSLVILWASFAVNRWLEHHQVGPWSNYLYGERTYLGLSLVARSALAWQIVAGTTLV